MINCRIGFRIVSVKIIYVEFKLRNFILYNFINAVLNFDDCRTKIYVIFNKFNIRFRFISRKRFQNSSHIFSGFLFMVLFRVIRVKFLMPLCFRNYFFNFTLTPGNSIRIKP